LSSSLTFSNRKATDIPASGKLLAASVRAYNSMSDITYLSQEQAQGLDVDLMGPDISFSIDQLMELAGLSVASAVHLEYERCKRVLILVGPGNNGGDGLVAARHLWQFGHQVEVCYPKRTDKPLFHGLVKQCEAHGIGFVEPEQLPSEPGKLSERADVVVDSLFGFSFKGPPRAPLDKLLDVIKPAAKPPPVVSVDIPSGWDVEQGDVNGDGIKPDMLISLTAPKLCAKRYHGTHYVGGRFVPSQIKEKYHLKLPEYPGVQQCVKLQ
jgi:NAD(P)H-hydrate epimerase